MHVQLHGYADGSMTLTTNKSEYSESLGVIANLIGGSATAMAVEKAVTDGGRERQVGCISDNPNNKRKWVHFKEP